MGNSIERFDKILKYNLFYPFARFFQFKRKFYTISFGSQHSTFGNVHNNNDDREKKYARTHTSKEHSQVFT